MPRRQDWLHRLVPRAHRLLSLILLGLPAAAYGRAGGGEGYHGGGGGGGHGGGGGGGGGGGDGGIVFLVIQLLLSHPAIAIPVLILCIILYLYSRSQQGPGGPGGGGPVPGPLSQSYAAPQVEQSIQQLRAHDPNFDQQAFYQRVNIAFGKIQSAWCAQNLTAVRPFISDGVHERFSLQFAEQKSQGWHDQMDNVEVHQISIVELHSDGLFDELSVRIAASAHDYRVSLANNTRLGGSESPEQFVEMWSFLRHRGAVTQPGRAGLIEGNCPNCGAPVELNQSANCTHCKALLRSGQYDWVLAEITQEVEWEGERHGQLPGVSAVRARDPDFNAVEVEDRASVVFWRKATADRVGKIDPLRKSASDTFCHAYAPSLRPAPDGGRQLFIDCAVGSVQLVGLIAGADGDRAVIEVRWSARRVLSQPGRQFTVLEDNYAAHSLFVLWRKPASRTDLGKGISSAHCPGCGAPESDSASSACEFCGIVLNDGAHGWVLIDLLDNRDPRASALLVQLNSQQVL